LGIILELFMIGLIRLSISFSSTFEKKGRRLIGLDEEGMLGGLLGLGMIVMIENFQ